MSDGGMDTMKSTGTSAVERAKAHFEKLVRSEPQ